MKDIKELTTLKDIIKTKNDKMFTFLESNIDIDAMLLSCINSNIILIGLTVDKDNNYFCYYKLSDTLTEKDVILNFLDDNFQSSKATKCKTGKFLKKHLPELKDNVLKSIVDRYKAAFTPLQLSIIINDDFSSAYNPDNYNGEFTSCMWGEDIEDFYSNYSCQIMTLQDNNFNLYGRAILWHDVKVETKDNNNFVCHFMDRIYTVSPEYETFFVNYAISNTIAYKQHQSNSCNSIIYNDTEITPCQMTAFENNTTYSVYFYPYLDTFKQLSHGCLNSGWNSKKTIGELRDTNGSIDLNDGYALIDGEITDTSNMTLIDNEWHHNDRIDYCHHCDTAMLDINSVYDVNNNIICSDCIEQNYCYIDSSEVEEGYYHTDDLSYNDILAEYIIINSAIYSDYHAQYFYLNDVVQDIINKDYYYNEEMTSVNYIKAGVISEVFILAEYLDSYVEDGKIEYKDNEYWLV